MCWLFCAGWCPNITCYSLVASPAWMIWCRSSDDLMQVRGWSDAGCRSVDDLMQVLRWSDAGPQMIWCRSVNDLMQIRGWSNAGPLMIWCRSMDDLMQVPGCANFTDGKTVGGKYERFWEKSMLSVELSSLSQVFISEWTLSLMWLVDWFSRAEFSLNPDHPSTPPTSPLGKVVF